MFLQCKNCPYFDTIAKKMNWGICRKPAAFTGMHSILKGPEYICTKHWDKEEKPNERNM